MDHGKAVKAPVRTARLSLGNGVTRPLDPLPSIADPQVLLDALPLAVLLVQPSPDDRWIIVASNQLFDSWANLSQHGALGLPLDMIDRSEEHTSELQSLMRISYAVFCLKKKTKSHQKQ